MPFLEIREEKPARAVRANANRETRRMKKRSNNNYNYLFLLFLSSLYLNELDSRSKLQGSFDRPRDEKRRDRATSPSNWSDYITENIARPSGRAETVLT